MLKDISLNLINSINKIDNKEIETYLGNRGYTILKNGLNLQLINNIKKNLLIKPFSLNTYNDVVSYPIFLESNNKLYVPRFWGIYYFGIPKEIKIGYGDNLNLIFKGKLRKDPIDQEMIVEKYLNQINFNKDLSNEDNDKLNKGNSCGLIELKTGGGKTVIGLKILSIINKKTIIFVHKTFLKDQWIERINEFLPDAKIGTIQGQIIDIENKDIVIAMIQSISMKEYPESIFKDFGFSLYDECFPSSTLIHTNKGKKKIGMLYEIWEKYGVNNDIEILSFNTITKKFEYKPLTYAWQKQSKDLIKFKLSKQIIECTINHKILTNKGYIEADKLNIGDIILCKYDVQHKDNLICPCLNDDQLQILYGSYLGDGCIQKTVKDRYRLRIIHCNEQKLYCEWKASMFGITELEYIEKNGYSQKEAYRFSSKCFDMDNSLANNKKEIPDWLINKIDERAIAIWFMDDGSLSKYTLKDGSVSCYATLHSNNFDYDNHIKLLNLFKKYNIECIISKSRQYNYLRFDNKNTKALLNLIRNYIHSNFEYKIDFISNNQYNWNNEFLKYGSLKITKKEYIKKLRNINVYDIEVKDNHNFIIATGTKDTNYIDGPIVSNCHHLSSEVFSNCLKKCNTIYSLGLSATMERKDGLTHVFKMYLGNICDIKFDLKKDNDNVLVKVINYNVKDDEDFITTELDYKGNPKYSTMISKLSKYDYRNDFIVYVIHNEFNLNKNQQMMILCHNRNMLAYIFNKLNLAGKLSVGYYVGGMKKEDLKISEGKQVILATYQMAAEALDIKSLTSLILATPKTDIVQAVGRILREKHAQPLVIDIVDIHNCFQNQFIKRKAFYNKQNYKIIKTTNELYMKSNNSNDIWIELKKKGKKTELREFINNDKNNKQICLI